MKPNIFKSRKFWLTVSDAFFASLALVLTWFLAPDKVKEVLTLVGIWQPAIIALIVGIAVEDAAKIANP